MADQVIGNAVVNIKIDEAQVNREAVKAGVKCADVFSKTVNAALGKSDPFASFDKLVSKQRSVRIKLDDSQAQKQTKALAQSIEKTRVIKIAADTKQLAQQTSEMFKSFDKTRYIKFGADIKSVTQQTKALFQSFDIQRVIKIAADTKQVLQQTKVVFQSFDKERYIKFAADTKQLVQQTKGLFQQFDLPRVIKLATDTKQVLGQIKGLFQPFDKTQVVKLATDTKQVAQQTKALFQSFELQRVIKIAADTKQVFGQIKGLFQPFDKEKVIKVGVDAKSLVEKTKSLFQPIEKQRSVSVRLDDKAAQAQLKALSQSFDKERLVKVGLDSKQVAQQIKVLFQPLEKGILVKVGADTKAFIQQTKSLFQPFDKQQIIKIAADVKVFTQQLKAALQQVEKGISIKVAADTKQFAQQTKSLTEPFQQDRFMRIRLDDRAAQTQLKALFQPFEKERAVKISVNAKQVADQIRALFKSFDKEQFVKIAISAQQIPQQVKALFQPFEQPKRLRVVFDPTQVTQQIKAVFQSFEKIQTVKIALNTQRVTQQLESIFQSTQKERAIRFAINAKSLSDQLKSVLSPIEKARTLKILIDAKYIAEKLKQLFQMFDKEHKLQVRLIDKTAQQQLKALQQSAEKEKLLRIKLEARQAEQQAKLLADTIQKERLLKLRLDDKAAQSQLRALQESATKEKEIKIKADARQAEQELRRLEREQAKIERKEAYKLRIDTAQAQKAISDTVKGVEAFQKMMGEIAAQKISANVSIASSLGRDTKELERQLAITKEIERHRLALAQASKLNIDDSKLQLIKRELNELHAGNTKAIKIKYDNSGMNDLKESISNMLDGIARGAAASIGHRLVGGITSAIRGAGNLMGDAVGGSLQTFGEYDKTITDFGLKAEASDEQVKRFKKTIADMQTTRTAPELAAAGVEMAKLGFTADQTADSLKSITSMADATGLKDLGKAATITATGMQVFQKSASEVNDVITTLSNKSAVDPFDFMQGFAKDGALFQSTGQTIQDLALMMGALRDSGFQAQEGAGAIKTALIQLTAPSDRGQAAMDKLGLKVYDAAGKMRPMVAILADMKSKMAGLSDEQRLPLLNDILGRRGGAAGAAVMNYLGTDKEQGLSSALANTEGASEKGAALKGKGFAGSIARLKKELQDIQIQFGEALGGLIAKIADMIGQVSQKLESAGLFDKLAEGAQKLTEYLEQNPQIIDQIVTAVSALATEGFNWINEQVQQFTEYLKENPTAIQDTIAEVRDLISKLGEAAIFAYRFTQGFADTLVTISRILGPLGDVVSKLAGGEKGSSALAENLGKAAGYVIALGAISTVVSTISSIAGYATTIAGLFGGWGAILTTVKGAIAAIGSILSGTVVLAIVAVGITLYNIVTYAMNWKDVLLGVKQYGKDIDDWVKSVIGDSKILNSIWGAIKGAVGYLLNPLGSIYEWIDKSVQETGIFRDQWNGLKSTFESVGGWIQNSVIGPILQASQALGGLIGMGGSGGNGAPLDSKTNTFKDVVVTAAVDGSGEPGMDYVTEANNGQNGENAWVPSLTAGKVIETRRDDRKLGLGGERGYGNVAIVRTMDEKSGEFVDILYAHFNELAVKVGDEVAVGTVLGTQGTTGSTSGPHTSVDFFGKDSNQPTQASLAMRDRLARDLSSGAKDLNSKIGQRQAQGGGMAAGVSMIDGTFGNGAVGGGMSQQQVMAMLEGGGNSQIAKLVGMAEGNRTADGSKTKNYYGHVDPNNGAYNIGSFSAQGSYNTGNAETSDQRVIDQLLRPNIQKLYEAASKNQVAVTPKLMMNYIDLLNQAPDAATGWSNGAGFLGNIASVRGRENDDEALKTLRAEGFRNKQGRLETTFDSLESLRYDQGRRQGEINTALGAFNLGSKGPQVSSTPSGRSPLGKSPMANTGDSENDIQTKREEREEAERRKAVEESRRYQDSETKARREAKKKGRDIARKQELAEIEKQSVGISDPSLRKALDFKKANLTTGAQSNDRIDELKDELSDLSTGLRRKQADLKAGGDVADKAKLLPNYSKAITETKALISQEEKLRDTLLGVSSAENTASINAEKLAQARQKRDANREKEYQAKVSIAERDKAVVASVGMPTDKIDNQIADYKRQYEGTKEIQVKIDQRQDLQSDLAKYQATLGKGKTDEQVKLKQGALNLIDKEIESIKKKYADEGIVLNLKIAAADRDEAIRDRNRTQQFEFDDKMLTMEGQLALAQQQEDQYAGLIELDIERERKLFDITKRLNEQNDALAKYNDSMATLQQNGVGLDSPAFKDMNSQLDTVRQNIALINQEKLQVIEQAELKKLKTAEEITARLTKLKAEVANEQFDATSKMRRSAINKRRERFGKYNSQAINEERQLIDDEKNQKIKEGRSAIQEQVKERARAGYKMTAEEIQNLDNAMTLAAENEYFDRLKEIPNIGREIGQSLGENLTGALKDLILTGKSLGEVMSNVFANLASQLLDLGFSGLFGGKGLGGLLGGLFGGKGAAKGGVVGAYKGGTVQNYARGKDSNIFGSILEAADRERSQSGGKTPKLAMVNASEIIIDAQTSDRLRKLTSNKIPNFAMGQNLDNLPVTNNITGDGISVNVGGVSVTSGNPNVDQKALQASIRGAITDQLLREKRPGGILA
jgi:TP901 family phage tail tape measure protein